MIKNILRNNDIIVKIARAYIQINMVGEAFEMRLGYQPTLAQSSIFILPGYVTKQKVKCLSVTRRSCPDVLCEKNLLCKISQNSQENTVA